MTVLRFSGPVLPDGEWRDVYVVGDAISLEPHEAEFAAEGWIVPGLVDAHCHIGLDEHGAVTDAEAEEQALTDRDGGALLIRDCGSALDTRWIQERDDLPRLIRCGRHLARTTRYLRNYAHEVEPEELADRAAREAAGSRRLDQVGRRLDFAGGGRPDPVLPGRCVRGGDLGRTRPRRAGDRPLLRPRGAAGADRGGHRLHRARHRADPDLIDAMVARGTALVPTVMQLAKFPEYAAAGAAKFPAYSSPRMTDLHGRLRETLMAAYDAGVPMYAGSDGGGIARHGNLAGEVQALADLGMPAYDALGAASWRARHWLGWNATLEEGAPADFVVYPGGSAPGSRGAASPDGHRAARPSPHALAARAAHLPRPLSQIRVRE